MGGGSQWVCNKCQLCFAGNSRRLNTAMCGAFPAGRRALPAQEWVVSVKPQEERSLDSLDPLGPGATSRKTGEYQTSGKVLLRKRQPPLHFCFRGQPRSQKDPQRKGSAGTCSARGGAQGREGQGPTCGGRWPEVRVCGSKEKPASPSPQGARGEIWSGTLSHPERC